MSLADELLIELKDRLQVTWEDDGTDRQLSRLITRGQSYMNEVCGTTFTFEDGSPERELMMERCRYDWNNDLDEFEDNFRKEMSRLILQAAVDDHEKGDADADGD